ncbi:acyltransferase [Neptuniibacter caesariensis]|uniref:Probable maltose O-acetyltransferase n=1 Tax=Neptuniibacter caesariensis TaxID=207954 RepID=A0A7U8C8H1_NEPCE|nr:acyltransferase [Neptuniibacter caesariensis]EAR62015.1 probable maltose O-acetyltransferase [Oceanospirillum sp. MED92] [Neptuniibacter caesariensis]
MNKLQAFKKWVKTADHPLAKAVKQGHDQLHHFEIPAFSILYKPLHTLHQLISHSLSSVMRVFYWTPMFKTRLSRKARRLYLYGGMPLVQGSLEIMMGDNCRLSGQTTFSGRWSGEQTPQLIIGDNVGIAWQTTIAVGSKVIIGDNVRIAGRGFLAGYPGHPVDPAARAKGLPDTEDQVGDIVLEKDVWLGSGVTVMKGVTIGEGTIVAAGSIVSRDLPPFVLAAGVPAKVIKPLDLKQRKRTEAESIKERAA